MYEVHVSVIIDAPAETVFERISDHQRFLHASGLTCRLSTLGREHRNGVGAVREVQADGNQFSEEITAFDPPRQFEYLIRRLVNPRGRVVPIRHQLGRMTVTAEGNRSRVDWLSRFKIGIPVIGWLVERVLGPKVTKGFRGLLEQAKADLEGRAEPVTAFPHKPEAPARDSS